MARPSKSTPLDLTQTHDLTIGTIERLTCPEGKAQAFLRDSKAPALRVRVPPAGPLTNAMTPASCSASARPNKPQS